MPVAMLVSRTAWARQALAQTRALQNCDHHRNTDKLAEERLPQEFGDGARELTVIPGLVAGTSVDLALRALAQRNHDHSGLAPMSNALTPPTGISFAGLVWKKVSVPPSFAGRSM
jgi:hypothetical protein